MINLLPPQIKEQVGYARKNAKLAQMSRRFIWLAAMLAAAFVFAHWQLGRTMEAAQAAQVEKNRRIQAYSETEKEARQLSQRLSSVKQLQDKQTRFSLLLADLASVTPRGAYINTIALTEDTQKPVSINATADTYQTAARLRDALASSSRIEAVDISSITNPEPGQYLVDLSISFKKEQFQ